MSDGYSKWAIAILCNNILVIRAIDLTEFSVSTAGTLFLEDNHLGANPFQSSCASVAAKPPSSCEAQSFGINHATRLNTRLRRMRRTSRKQILQTPTEPLGEESSRQACYLRKDFDLNFPLCSSQTFFSSDSAGCAAAGPSLASALSAFPEQADEQEVSFKEGSTKWQHGLKPISGYFRRSAESICWTVPHTCPGSTWRLGRRLCSRCDGEAHSAAAPVLVRVRSKRRGVANAQNLATQAATQAVEVAEDSCEHVRLCLMSHLSIVFFPGWGVRPERTAKAKCCK